MISLTAANSKAGVDDEVLEEASYHLRKLGLSFHEIGQRFEISDERAEELYGNFQRKLSVGVVKDDPLARNYWESVSREAGGDVKVTFVSQDGFHHAWKSDLEKMDSQTLMVIFERSKEFLEADSNKYFLNIPPPVGYDPLAFSRQVKTAVELIDGILTNRSASQKSESG